MGGIVTRAVLAAAFLLASNAMGAAQQSWGPGCGPLPPNPDPGLAEFCQGITAASGNNGESAPDPQAAILHFQRAGALGYAEAEATLGDIYASGWQVRQDYAIAAKWYAKAVAQGNAGAKLKLGNLYAKGLGVDLDPVKARELIQGAANQGLAPTQSAPADISGQGPAVPGAAILQQAVARIQGGDRAGGAALMLQAAEQGNPTATYDAGHLFETGDGVAQDPVQAARWYMKGAALGEASSEAAVGQLYEAGNQVAEDWGVAAQWYAKSAQQGNRVGEFRLGRAYEYGVGVPLDLGTAVQWYDKAAAQGDSQAAILAKYIRDNHGVDVSSYSDEEKAVIAPYEMQPWMLRVPPSGRAFRNTGERMAYFQTWAAAAADYENCLSAHANASTATCPAPVPPN